MNFEVFSNCVVHYDNDNFLSSLEYSWNMKHGRSELRKYSMATCICLDDTLFGLFVDDECMLVPDANIIDLYRNACGQRGAFPNIEGDKFNYRFVAHPKLQLFQKSNEPVDIDDPKVFDKLTRPYPDFVATHLHPRLAILSTGLKLTLTELDKFMEEDPALGKTLSDISYIFKKWSTEIFPDDFREYHLAEGFDLEATLSRAEAAVDVATKALGQGNNMCLIDRSQDVADCHLVDYVLLVSWISSEYLFKALEYHWNMPNLSLDIFSPSNILRLGVNLHGPFDQGLLLLLPNASIIEAYYKVRHQSPANFPQIEEPKYEYTLLGHPDLKGTRIFRRESDSVYTEHIHPFPNFPTLISHVHPRYVICHAGKALYGVYGMQYRDAYPHLKDSIMMISAIYDCWIIKRLQVYPVSSKRILACT